MSVSAERMEPIEHYLSRYQKDGEPPGWWIGNGPELLGFGGVVTPLALRNVFHGYAADGKGPLIQQQNHAGIHAGSGKARKRASGLCLTFSVPPDASVAWGIGPNDLSSLMMGACFNAADRTITLAEDQAAWVRVGGIKHQKGKLIVAFMPQTCSSRLTPDLTMRCLIAPVGVGPDGLARELNSRQLFKYKAVLDAMFRATLAHELRQVGFHCTPAEKSFTIQGISARLGEHFATRRLPTEHGSGLRPIATAYPRMLSAMGLTKNYRPIPKHVREFWRAEAARFGVTPATIVATTGTSLMTRLQWFVGITPSGDAATGTVDPPTSTGKGVAPPSQEVGHLLRNALHTWGVRDSTGGGRDRKDYLSYLLDSSIGSGIAPETVLWEMDRWSASGIAWPGVPRHEIHARACQSDIVHAVSRMNNDRSFVLPDANIKSVMATYAIPRSPNTHGVKPHAPLSSQVARPPHTRGIGCQQANAPSPSLDHQGQALLLTLTRRPGRVVVVSHRFTKQRDLAIQAAADAWRGAGYEVVAVTPYRRTSMQMERATGIPSMTHRTLQLMLHPTFSSHVTHVVSQFARAAFNRPALPLDSAKIGPSRVLVVDRAHQLSLEDLKQLVSDTRQLGGKLVLLAPHIDDWPRGRASMSAVLLNDLSNRAVGSIEARFTRPQTHNAARPPHDRQPGMEIS